MGIRGAKLTFSGGKKFLGVQKASGGATSLSEKQKKVATFFLFFFWRQ